MKIVSHLLVTLTFLCGISLAQEGGTVGIYGTVTDPANAAVSGANVTVTHVETAQVRTTKTNTEGQYQFQLLPLGSFRISVEQTGFSKVERTGLVLQVNDNVKVDVRLQIGSVATSVEVVEEAQLVQTHDSLVKEVVDSRRVVDLPLNGRVLADLAILSPGVVPANGAYATQTYDQNNGYKAALNTRELMINGARPNQTYYTLDGGINVDIMYNLGLPFPFPDATQEFSIQTAGQGVDIGHGVGGTINVVTKSGTNQVHGDVFWFIRNTALNAENFFSKTPDNLKRNQGGFTLGAPILKNKLFVFGGFERTWVRQINGSNSTTTMPLLHRQGNFSDIKTAILDPTTGVAFPGNQIPASRLSPAMLNLLAWEPPPNSGTKYVYPTYNTVDIDQEVLRVDYQANAKNFFYGRFYRQDGVNEFPPVGKNLFSVKNGGWMIDDNLTLAWTFVPTSHLSSDAHLTGFLGPAARTLDCVWGTVATFGVQINPRSCEVSITTTGSATVSLSSSSRTAPFNRADFGFSDAWRYMKGAHSLVFGADFNWNRYNMDNPYHGSGVFTFSGACSGNGQADVMLGCMVNFLQGNGTTEYRREHYRGLYAGDAVRLSPRFTLNLGLRWEPFGFVTDQWNRNVVFEQQLYNSGWVSQMYHNSPPGLVYPGDTVNGQKIGPAATDISHRLFAPRVGLAWDVTGNGRLSVRAGYGLYYSVPETYILNGMTNSAPFGYDQLLQGGQFDNPYAGREQYNIFPLTGEFLKNPNLVWPPAGENFVLEPKYNIPSTNSWNLVVERQFGASWMLRAAYIGSRSNHLEGTYNINPPIYKPSLTLLQNQATEDTTRRAMKQFTDLFVLCSCLPSNYNALQVSFNKRFRNGLTLLTNWSWSKAMDYISDGTDIQTMSGGSNAPLSAYIRNPSNPLSYRGPADWDTPQRFVESFVYRLPDPGKRLGLGIVSAVARNWSLTGILVLQSGRPFSVTTSADVLAGAGAAMGEQIGPLVLSGQSRGRQIAQYFNAANVIAAATDTYGNMGRNSIRGPNFRNLDTSIYRQIDLPFRESMKLTVRFEAFNVTNRVNLSNPSASVGGSNFDAITSTQNDPRILQFAVKFAF